MKRFLLTASALTFAAIGAQAQMVFDGAEISAFGHYPIGGGISDHNTIGIAGNVAVSFGNFGIQIDAGHDALQGPLAALGKKSSDQGIHTYYKFNDTIKAGVFYTTEANIDLGWVLPNFTSYGVEALFSFSKFDVDVSIAGSNGIFGEGIILSANGYYIISERFEISAGVRSFFVPNVPASELTVASLSASYTPTNAPVTLGIAYHAGFYSTGLQGGSASARISYSFGANGTQRLFRPRNFGFLDAEMVFSGAN